MQEFGWGRARQLCSVRQAMFDQVRLPTGLERALRRRKLACRRVTVYAAVAGWTHLGRAVNFRLPETGVSPRLAVDLLGGGKLWSQQQGGDAGAVSSIWPSCGTQAAAGAAARQTPPLQPMPA
jgi:hypothetical protein